MRRCLHSQYQHSPLQQEMEDEEAALAYDQAALTMRGPLAHMSMGKICSKNRYDIDGVYRRCCPCCCKRA
ncbi:hypothetical protein H5410_015885 [Solanum commersonii]|uniref:Uncharacterized protein n=1 Tax=Solanum commersonii TaxID=4109 RepID=A0A9J5ZUQ7_SOLCO|nr:hypothetical protein H5410_015885 [Solanum commersonii]